MVISRFRPLSKTPSAVLTILHEIETAAGLPFTGIINNSNLGAETTAEDVLSSLDYARDVSWASGLPIIATSVSDVLYEELKDRVNDLFCLRLQARPV